MQTTAMDGTPSFVDDVVDTLLEGWSGLRFYLRQRRAGKPADPVMDNLLAELLRVNLGADHVKKVVAHLTKAG